MTARRLAGLAGVAAALVLNQPMLERFVLADGHLESPVAQLAIAVADIVLLVVGASLLLGVRSFRPSAAVLAFLSVCTGLVIGEFMARCVPRFEPRPRWFVGDRVSHEGEHFLSDSLTGWRMRPSYSFEWQVSGRWSNYRSNRDGFRSARELGADSGRAAVVLIGDSFTFGSGVQYDETFGARLEAALPRTVIWNLGMPGFGLDQIYRSLRYQVPALHPALVVFVFIDDDLRRSFTSFMEQWGVSKPMYVLEGDTLREATPRDRPPWVVRYLERHSWLWTAGRSILAPLMYKRPDAQWWQLNAEIIRAAVTEGRRQGVPLLFVRLPQDPLLHPDFTLMRSLMDSLHADYLDLADSARGMTRAIHLERDNHLSPDGHQYVADVLDRWIQSRVPELVGPRPDSPP